MGKKRPGIKQKRGLQPRFLWNLGSFSARDYPAIKGPWNLLV
jgi:hypothetical protein